MVGRRGEAPLVPPYKFRRPNKAMALAMPPSRLVEAPASHILPAEPTKERERNNFPKKK